MLLYYTRAYARAFLTSLGLLVFLGASSHAATKYWVANSTGNWNTSNHWSATPGGAGGAGVPGTTDDVVFNSLRIGTCTINVPVTVSSITISAGYTNTVIQLSTVSVTTLQNFVINAGTYSAITSSMTISSNVVMTGGILNLSGSSMTVRGDWTLGSAATFLMGTSTVTFSTSTVNHTITTIGDPFFNVQFNGTNGSWVLVDSMTVTSTMTLTAGTLDPSATNCSGTSCNIRVAGSWQNTGGVFEDRTSTVTLSVGGAATMIRSRGFPFYNLEVAGTGTWVMADSMTVASNVTLSGGTLDPSSSNLGLLVGGNWLNTGGSYTQRISTITFNATTPGMSIRSRGFPFRTVIIGSNSTGGYWTLVDSMTVSSVTIRPGNTLELSGFGLTVTSFTNAGMFVLQSLERVTSAPNGLAGSTITYTATSGTPLIFSTWTYRNLEIDGGASTVFSSTGPLTVNETLTLNSGTLSMALPAHSLSVGNNWVNNSGGFTTGTSTISFTGNTSGFSIKSRGYPFHNLQISGTANGYWTLVDSMTVISTITFTAGTLDPSAANCSGVTCNIRVGGSWQNTGGGFEDRTSTITFTGVGAANVLRSRGFPFHNIQLDGNGTWVMADSMTVTSNVTLTDGTLDTGSQALLISGSWWNPGAVFLARSSTATFTAGSAQSLQTSGYPFFNLQLFGAGGSWVMIDSMTVTSTMTLTAGTLDPSASNCSGDTCNIRVGGSWQNTGGVFENRTSTVTFSGAGAANVLRSRGFPFHNLQLSGTGTWVMADSMTVVSTITLTTGTLDPSASNHAILLDGNWVNTGGAYTQRSSTVSFTSTSSGRSIRSRGFPFRTVTLGTVGPGGYFTLIDSMTVSTATIRGGNTLDLAGFGLAITSFTNAGMLRLQSLERVTGAPLGIAGSTITFTATSGTPLIFSTWTYRNLEIDGGATTVFSSTGPLTVNETLTLNDGILNMALPAHTLSVANNWVNNSGGFTTGTSTISFTGSTSGFSIKSRGFPFYNLQMNGTANGYWTLVDSMTVTSTMTLTGGTLDTSADNCGGLSCNIQVRGSWWNNSGTFIDNTSTVTLTGTGLGYSLKSRGFPFYKLQTFGTGGYWTLVDSMTVTSTMTLTAGTLDTRSGGNLGVLLGSDWLNVGGSFVSNLSTITFNGTSGQRWSELSDTTFNVIVDSNTSSGGVTFASSFTATVFRVNGAALAQPTTVYFNSNSTFTIATLDLRGAAGDMIWIRPTNDSVNWYLNNTVNSLISYVDVRGSNANPGLLIDADDGTNINSLLNYNWNFGGTGALKTWWGTSSSNWFTGANWDDGVPAAQDSVLIVSTASTMPNLTGAVAISSLTINSDATLTLSGHRLTVSSFTNAGTLVMVGTEPVTSAPNSLVGSSVTLNSAGTSIVLSTWVYHHLVINGGASSVFNIVAGSITLEGNLTLSGGTLDPTTSNFGMGVGGDWINTAGGFTARSSTVTFTSTSLDETIRTRGFPFANVVFSGSSGYWTLIDSMTMTSTMTIAGGTFDTSSNNWGVTVGGSWLTTTGAFNMNTSTIVFTAASPQKIQSAASSFYNFQLASTGSGSWVLQDDLSVASTMTLTAGTLDPSASNCSSGSCQIDIAGSLQNTGGVFTARTSTMNFTGSGTGNVVRSRGFPLTHVSFTGSGYWTLADSMTMTGDMTISAGTFDTSASNLGITVGGKWSNTSGSFNTRTSTIIFNSGSAETLETSGYPFYNLQFNNASGSWVLIDSMTVTSTMTLTLGTLDPSASNCSGESCNIRVAGSWSNTGGVFEDRTSTVTLSLGGAATVIRSRGFPFYNLELAGTGTWVMTDSMTVVSTITLTSGTLDPSASNLGISVGGGWINTIGSYTQRNSIVTFSAANDQSLQTRGFPFRTAYFGNGSSTGGYFTLIGSMTVSTMTIRSGNTLDTGGFGIAITSFTNAGMFRLQSLERITGVPLGIAGSTITFTASSGSPLIFSTWTYRNLEIDGGASTVFSSTGPLTVNETLTLNDGTLSLALPAHSLTVGSNWMNNSGGFTTGTSTITFNGSASGLSIKSRGYPFYNLQVSGGASSSWVLVDSMTVTSTMTLTGGTLDTSATNCAGNSCDIAVRGSWWNNAGIFVDQTGTVTFTGTGNGYSLKSRGFPFHDLHMDGSGGYWTMVDSLTLTRDMLLEGGTLDTRTGSNFGILLGEDWLNNGGRFVSNSSTITFNGSAAQNWNELSDTTFNVFIDSNTSSGGVTFASSFTLTALRINSAGLASPTTVYFNSGSTCGIL